MSRKKVHFITSRFARSVPANFLLPSLTVAFVMTAFALVFSGCEKAVDLGQSVAPTGPGGKSLTKTNPPTPLIVRGAIDTVHRNVGAMAVEFEPGVKTFICSGSLIADTVFLTAAHCLNFLPPEGIDPSRVYVTFDVNVESATTFIQASAYHFIPGGWRNLADPLDLGVIILSQHVTTWDGQALQPVKLPKAGTLDRMAARAGLRGKSFVNVGYGLNAEFKGAPPRYTYDGNRRVSTSPFQALLPAWLVLNMNSDATGQGGDCYGDSGSPKFIPNTDTVVATVTWGDRICRATSFDYRLDIPQARAFLGQFVQLP